MGSIDRTIECASVVKSQRLDGEGCSGVSSTKLRHIFLGMMRAYPVEVDGPSQVYWRQSHPCLGFDFIVEIKCYHCWELERKFG